MAFGVEADWMGEIGLILFWVHIVNPICKRKHSED